MKILVIEDEPEMLDNIVRSLREEKYMVETATDYPTAREKLELFQYDCILLDIGLPGGSGIALLREHKEQQGSGAIIIVSAKDSLDDKITGLNLGADDYLPKPFHLAELHARVKALLRRKLKDGNDRLSYNNITIDTEERTVHIGKVEIALTRKEYDILVYLVLNKGRLVHKAALAEHVWGDGIDAAGSYDFIYSQIKHLRKKLNDGGANAEIQSIYGVGYKLVEI
jgi:DNA-binding response OmpR family regulator